MLIKIFAIVLFFFLFVAIIGITMIGNILRILFGSSKPASGNYKSGNRTYNTHQADPRPHETAPKKQKVFDDDEGEYVNFEEIKDDK